MLKKIIIIFCIILLPNFVYSAEFSGSVSYHGAQDVKYILKKANDNLRLYEKETDVEMKSKYLKQALRYYYICVKSDFSNIDAHIGLGKVYDEMGVDRYAKMEFNSAYNIDNKNPLLNYRYGDFYYKRRQLSSAQNYYERAYRFGYSKNVELNKKMAQTYIKLAEPQKAEQHLKFVSDVEKAQKTKASVNNAIKVAKGIDVTPQVTKNIPQKVVTEKPKNVSFKEKPKKVTFEEAVLKANKIKMIDDVDKLKPMYYLFIK